MTIGVYTFYDEVFKPCADITVPVLKAYCERHGYPLTIATERLSDQRVVWDKIPLLLENLHLNDWSFFIEADLLITNSDLKLEDFIWEFQESDFVIPMDTNGPNLCVFFVKDSVQARVVLSDAWHIRERSDIGSEQHAIVEALRDSERVLVTHVHQKLFNSYPYASYEKLFNSYPYASYGMPETTEGNWTPGDFALRLPGMTVEKRVEIFSGVLDVMDLESNEEQ